MDDYSHEKGFVQSRKPPYSSVGSWAGYAKTRKGKIVYPRKTKSVWKWKRVINIILAIPDFDRNSDIVPCRAVLKLANRRLYENLDYDDYRAIIGSLLVEDEGEGIRQIWKEVTLGLIREIIRSIPKPEPLDKVSEMLDSLLMRFAEEFYDWLFQFSF